MVVGTTYTPVLRIAFAHEYYGKDPVPLRLDPTLGTEAALACAQCRLRPGAGQLEIYAGTPIGRPPQQPGELPATLGFHLSVTDPEFLSVTAPDWSEAMAQPGTTCFYLGPDALTGNIMHSASGLSLPVVGRTSRVTLSAPVAGKTASLRAHLTGSLVWSAPMPGTDQSFVDLAAHDVPEGRYCLEVDGATLRDLYLSDAPPGRLFGAADIPFAGTAPSAGDTAPRTLTVSFAAAAPRWRYVLCSFDPNRDLSGAQVTAPAGTQTFSGPERQIRRGRTVWVLESQGPIPLRLTRPREERFVLTIAAGSQPAPPPLTLPVGGPDTTRMEASPDGPALWSTLYITV